MWSLSFHFQGSQDNWTEGTWGSKPRTPTPCCIQVDDLHVNNREHKRKKKKKGKMILHTFGQWSSLASVKKEMMQHREEVNIKVTSGRTEAKIYTYFLEILKQNFARKEHLKDVFQKEIESFVEGQRIIPTKAAWGQLLLLKMKLLDFQGKNVGIKATITTIKSLWLLSHTSLSFQCQHKSTQRLNPLSEANTHHPPTSPFFKPVNSQISTFYPTGTFFKLGYLRTGLVF